MFKGQILWGWMEMFSMVEKWSCRVTEVNPGSAISIISRLWAPGEASTNEIAVWLVGLAMWGSNLINRFYISHWNPYLIRGSRGYVYHHNPLPFRKSFVKLKGWWASPQKEERCRSYRRHTNVLRKQGSFSLLREVQASTCSVSTIFPSYPHGNFHMQKALAPKMKLSRQRKIIQ